MDSKTVLEAVQNGSMSIEEAERFFARKAYEDMGYANLYEAATASVDDSRYHAVNLQNYNTVEFRIFAGTDAESRVLSCLNVTNDIVTFAMTHTPEECLNTTWSEVTKERT